MQLVRALRLLSLPAAIALGTVLALACSSGGPTSPDQAPSFVVTKATFVDDLGTPSLGDKDCIGGYSLISAEFTIGVDLDGNGWVCQKNGGNGSGGKKR